MGISKILLEPGQISPASIMRMKTAQILPLTMANIARCTWSNLEAD
jgi:hypothetical protein